MCRYLRAQPSEHGLVRLGSYLRAWGWIYLVFTLLLLLKRERRHKLSGRPSRVSSHCGWNGYVSLATNEQALSHAWASVIDLVE